MLSAALIVQGVILTALVFNCTHSDGQTHLEFVNAGDGCNVELAAGIQSTEECTDTSVIPDGSRTAARTASSTELVKKVLLPDVLLSSFILSLHQAIPPLDIRFASVASLPKPCNPLASLSTVVLLV
jgi:hypothetical protein